MAEVFWDWAVARYGRDGVAEQCLVLQDDHGQNVPLLLWAAWAAAHGARIESLVERAAQMARIWSDEVVVPLRQVRRRLKTTLSEGDELVRPALREQVKAAELKAEHCLMAQLEALVEPGAPIPAQGLAATVSEGLMSAARVWSAEIPAQDLAKLTRALTKDEFLGYND